MADGAAASGSVSVGAIHYEVALDTSKAIQGQRAVDQVVQKVDARLTSVAQATRTHVAALQLQGAVSRTAANDGLKLADSFNRQALSAKQLSFATRTLPAQFTDIFTQLAAGQSPMQIFIQQGGQIKDVFGGVGPALRAVGVYVLGLLNPVTAVAAVLGVLGAGFFKGTQESQGFTRAIELSGNASGVTADQLNTLAARMDSLDGVTRGKAAEALTLLVEAGVQGGQALGKFAEAAIRLEQAGGPAVESTAKAFAALARDPLQAALRLNEATGFLTVELYKQIKALDDQGKKTEAARLAQEAYADSINRRAPQVTENIGLLERAWRGVARAAKEGWDAILNIGREQTVDERITQVREQIGQLESEIAARRGQRSFTPAIDRTNQQEIAAKEALVAQLREELKLINASSSAKANAAAEDAARVKAVTDAAAADKKRDAAKFDAVDYLLGLQERLADGFQKIDIEERRAMQRADELRKEGKLSADNYEKARLLIAETGAKARTELRNKEEREAIETIFRASGAQLEAERKAEQERGKGREFARDVIGGGDEFTRLQLELEKKSAILAEHAARDQGNEQLYAQARVELERQTWEKMRDIRERDAAQRDQINSQVLQSYGSLFSGVMDVLRRAGKDQTAIGKALFLAERAIAVATIIANTEVGASKATSLGPFGIPLATYIRASGYASAGLVAGLAIGDVAGRQYGGPASAGSLYQVNETGRPEMFTAANGAQYMLPTQSGQVTAADKAGGGVNVQVQVINQHPTAEVSVTRSSDGQQVQIAVLEVASQIRENSGPVWSALRGATNVQGRF